MALGCVVILLMAVTAQAPAPADTQPAPLKGEGWEFVGGMGAIRTVFVDSSRLDDREFLAKVITTLLDRWGRERPVQIDFFDDRALTPLKPPYPPESKPHHRAKFNFNPANGMMRFVRILPPLPDDPSGKRRQVEEKLPFAVAP